MKPSILLALLALPAACAGPQPSTQVERVPASDGMLDVRVTDKTGVRVMALEVERAEDGFRLVGNLQGTWLDTASCRTVRLAAHDKSGATVWTGEAVAKLVDNAGKGGLDRARVSVKIPDPQGIAALDVSVQPAQ